MAGHQLVVAVQQLNVQHLAEGIGPVAGRVYHVGFQPNGFARRVPGLVEVQVGFLGQSTCVKPLHTQHDAAHYIVLRGRAKSGGANR